VFLLTSFLDLPEVVDLAAVQDSVAEDAIYVDASEFRHVDKSRILRYDLTLPLLLTLRYQDKPLRVWSEGKVYRQCSTDATHLEAFHQAEVFLLGDKTALDPWEVAGQVLKSIEAVLPGSPVRLIPTHFPMCSAAWELEAERNGRKLEVIAWGIFTDRIVGHVGGDPERHVAIGIGYGLERLEGLRYDIDDIRRVDTRHPRFLRPRRLCRNAVACPSATLAKREIGRSEVSASSSVSAFSLPRASAGVLSRVTEGATS
jgi:phenylalanyl-tRNA synthetase alpha subunit